MTMGGLEPPTYRYTNGNLIPLSIRSPDLSHIIVLVVTERFELSTTRLSGVRSTAELHYRGGT